MDVSDLKGCGRCGGDLYFATDPYGSYKGCTQRGQHYYPLILNDTISHQPNGNGTDRKAVNLEYENGTGNNTFKITPKGTTVFREYEGLIAMVEDEVQSTFKTYRFFDNIGRLTRFGSFVKDIAEKNPDKYSRLGEFVDKTHNVISSRSRSRKKINFNKKVNGGK